MSEATCYEPYVLKRYGLASVVEITEDHFTEQIQVTLENGQRIFFSPRLRVSDMGIKPGMDIYVPRSHDPGFGSPSIGQQGQENPTGSPLEGKDE